MAGRTENEIQIEAPPEFVFEITNDLTRWTEMFDDYDRVEILERDGDCFRFRLTTRPDESGEVHSWTSRRCLFRDELRIEAERLEPLVPWAEMRIRWTYTAQADSTLMRWIQDFRIAAGLPYTDQQGEDFINGNSKTEMVSVKRYVEAAWKEASRVARP